ncbi:hypothetical protein K466DRAFT_570948 [Polyporus arcularius HHB13444]|uniref:Uncharacterized protein n=1 Tax=Polyporus arcularius HHB13444 TaxID=1314778 RepID=A0A5C3NKM1_9APHY|nr:hypothetical protein K466DRAFT_570948 [Polyporus arcularius HHB13444]
MSGRRAESQTLHSQLESKFVHHWIDTVAQRYKVELESNKSRKKGVHKICREVEQECFAKTKHELKLVPNMKLAHVNGRKSIWDFNAEKQWLKEGKEEAGVWAGGFQKGVRENNGHQWFVERHEELHPYWTHLLNHSRACAINPANHEAYFDLLEKVIQGEDNEEPIADECIYGMDETEL